MVIPFLGPSDVRDGLGRIPDSYGNPANYITNDWRVHYGLWGMNLLDARYRLLSLDATIDSAYDPYLFLKNAYLQRRDFLASGGAVLQGHERERRRQAVGRGDEGGNESAPPAEVTAAMRRGRQTPACNSPSTSLIFAIASRPAADSRNVAIAHCASHAPANRAATVRPALSEAVMPLQSTSQVRAGHPLNLSMPSSLARLAV